MAVAPTPSGILHDLRDPGSAIILDEDVRDVGAVQCRWNGALRAPNLRHWAWCALRAHELYGAGVVVRYAACHDLHEVVTLDVPGPMKLLLGGAYGDLEAAWAGAFHRHYGLTWPVPEMIQRAVHEIDMRARIVEVDQLAPANHPLRAWAAHLGAPATPLEAASYAQLMALDVADLWCIVRRGLASGPELE